MEIIGISFQLNGEVNAAGDIRLKEVLLFTAAAMSIPPSLRHLNADRLLSEFRDSYTSKLRNSHVG